MTKAEIMQAKPGVCRIIALAFDIDTKMEPTLKDRIGNLKCDTEANKQLIQKIYDEYIEEVADKVLEKCVDD